MVFDLQPAEASEIEIFLGLTDFEASLQTDMIWPRRNEFLLIVITGTYIHVDVDASCQEGVITLDCCANLDRRGHGALWKLTLGSSIIVRRSQRFLHHSIFLLFGLKELTESVFERCCVVAINANFRRGSQKGSTILIHFERGWHTIVYRGRHLIIDLKWDFHWIIVIFMEPRSASKSFLLGYKLIILHYDACSGQHMQYWYLAWHYNFEGLEP